ncbi:NEW3 domain-containing protein [Halococcus sediminicola]|uniref:NEW3 domain-containing protein n=1 Tax=Halococcus sediminicola TaxID=1264579 RepID=UPI0006787DF3|nr:NEW3 domain-containing protein [Halococcus sediminicola]
MNRAAVAAVLVVLLTVQGSVAGVLTGDSFSNARNDTTDETTVSDASSATSIAESSETTDGVAAANAEADDDEGLSAQNADGTPSDDATTTESITDGTTEPTETSTTQTPTSTETEAETTTETATDTPTETDTSSETGTSDGERSETNGSDEPDESDEVTDSNGSGEEQTSTEETTSSETPSSTEGEAPESGSAPPGDTSGASEAPPSGGEADAPPQSSGAAEGASAPSTGAPSAAAGGSPPTEAAPSSAAAGGAAASGSPAGASQSPGGTSGAAVSGATSGRSAGASGAAPSAGAAPSGGAPSGASGAGAAPAGAGAAPSGAPSGAGAAPSGSSGAGVAGAGGAGAAAGDSGASSDAEFEITSVSSDVVVGGTGNVSVTIENTGEDATDAVVSFQSQSGDLTFGQSPETSRFVGDWDEGESRTVEVTMRASPSADTAEYPIQATVSYDDDDGNQSQSAPLTFGVTLESEQGFTLGGVDSDLAVGEKGTISGTISNEGPEAAADAVLAVSPNGSRDVVPRQSQYVLGDLDADESESFELPVLVNGTAEPGERQVQFVVQYYDSDGNPLQSKPLNAQVDIDAESDDFEITDVEADVEAGEQGTLSVTMNNTGENVTDTTVSFQSLSGSILFGESANASQFVADWDTGEQRTFEFDVTAADSTTGGNYPMQASLTYDDADGDQAQSGPFSFGVEPDEGQDDFAVVSSSSEVQVGDEGPVSVTLENRGENVSEATVSLQSLTGDILFGRAANATQFVGEWPAGAERTVTFNATASNQSETQSYPLQTSISYKDSNGDVGQSDSFTLGITPQPEQTFTLSNTNSTLAVGDEGNVTGTITNQGPQDTRNAVVTLVSESQNIQPQTTEVAIGSLPAGEAANFSLPVEVTDGAEPGQQQFSFIVEYDNQNGDTRRSGTLDTQVGVEPQRDEFLVERANSSLDVGASGTVTLNVTNNRDSTVSNVNAKAFVDDPLSLSSDEAYIAELNPGETQQIAFDVSSGGDASAGEYPLSVDFQYDSGGESKLSDTYEVPVELVASDDGGILSSLSVMWGLGALLVLFGVGWVWSRR